MADRYTNTAGRWLQAGALGALALTMAATAIPGAALAQDGHREHGERGNGGGNRGGNNGGGQQRQQAPRPQAAPQQQARPQMQGQMQARPQMNAPQMNRGGNAQWNRGERLDNANRDNGGRDNGNRGAWNAGGNNRPDGGNARPDTPRPGAWNAGNNGRPGGDDNRPGRGDDKGRPGNDGRPGGSWNNGRPGNDGRPGGSWNNGRPGGNGAWNRNDWRRDNRYDWRSYRSSHGSIYRPGGYFAPYRGYSYRRVGIGFSLGALFYGERYWINDPWYYRLPPAYEPYRWVRYYDDVLLVNVYTGDVVDVIYDFFD